MNRVTAMIQRATERMNAKLASGEITQAKVDETSRKSDMAFDEYCLFQERKSLAVAEGKLTLEEGQTVYAYLGSTPETFNSQPFPVKAVLTQLFAELIGVKR